MEKLLIIDGNSLVNRAFYALPLLTNADGEFSNAVYGFTNILIKFINEQKPSYIAVAFDHSRHTFRTDMYKDYKGTRKAMPDELRSQMPILKNLLSKMNINIFEIDGIEADDIIGTIAKHSGVQNIILSGDRDVLQLVDKNTEVWLTKKGITDVLKVDENNIQELFGYLPKQVIDMKSLMGDSADNIPGVSGIGEKTALNLISTYGSLDGVYEHINEISGKLKEKLETNKETAYLSYALATIKTDCDVKFETKDFCYDFPFSDDVKEIFERYSFKTLLKHGEYFDLKEQKPKTQTKTVVISTKEELKNVLNKKIKYFVFNFLNNFEFMVDNETVYKMSSQLNLLSMLETKDIVECIMPILQNEQVVKITYDLKSHFYIDNCFLKIKGTIFDVSIANYLTKETKEEKPSTNELYSLYVNLTKELKEKDLEFIYNDIEMPLTYVLFEMEQNGFMVDKNILFDLSKKAKVELENLKEKILSYSNEEFNLNSPKQLAHFLFDELSLSDKDNKKHSTDIEVLKMLSKEHEVIDYIVSYRKIQKLISTYYDVYEKLVNEKGEIIRTTYNQTLTSTGRLSSSEPNLQNIPIRDDEGKNLRKIFISRFDGGYIVSADYSQIELRLLAAFSNDPSLVEAYKNGVDVHSLTASKIFDCDIACVDEKMRRIAKTVNFGIIYGMSAYGLANRLSVWPKEAKMFIDKYFETYKSVDAYMQQNIEDAKQNKYAKTLFGRRRYIPELFSTNFNIKEFGSRVARNMPLQGSASDIIKIAMIKVSEELKKQNLQSKLILQIHDELIIDAKKDELNEVKKILKDCMENVVNLSVKLNVEINYGQNWFDAK